MIDVVDTYSLSNVLILSETDDLLAVFFSQFETSKDVLLLIDIVCLDDCCKDWESVG